jgi:hypothetical protein
MYKIPVETGRWYSLVELQETPLIRKFLCSPGAKVQMLFDGKITNNVKNIAHIITEIAAQIYPDWKPYVGMAIFDKDDDFNTIVDPKDVFYRVDPYQLAQFEPLAENLKPGCFVHCKVSKGKYKWRMVSEIRETTIWGRCASGPSNGVLTILEV